MSATIQNNIKELFLHYEKYFQDLNFSEQAKLFGSSMIAAEPKGIAFHKNNYISRLFYASAMRGYYKKTHMTSIKILTMDQKAITNEFVIIKIHWGATFKKTGDKLIEFDVSYIVSMITDNPEIIMFISHEDEQKSLSTLGIIP